MTDYSEIISQGPSLVAEMRNLSRSVRNKVERAYIGVAADLTEIFVAALAASEAARKQAEAKLAEVTAERDDLAERNKENSRLAEENAAGLREAEATVATLTAQIEAMRGAGLALCDAAAADDGSDHHHFTISGRIEAFRRAAALTTKEQTDG